MSLGYSSKSSPIVSHCHSAVAPTVRFDKSFDQEALVVIGSSLVPMVEVEMVQLPPSLDPSSTFLDETQKEEGSCPRFSEHSGSIVGSSPASYFMSGGPQVIRSFQVASRRLKAHLPVSFQTSYYFQCLPHLHLTAASHSGALGSQIW